jgi:hypothetical protein
MSSSSTRSPAPRIPRAGRVVIPCREHRAWYEVTVLRWLATAVITSMVGLAMLGVAFIVSRVLS